MSTQSDAPPDILRLAQDSLQAWEREALGLLPAADFDGKQAQLRLHLAACIDARRSVNALERIAAALERLVMATADATDGSNLDW